MHRFNRHCRGVRRFDPHGSCSVQATLKSSQYSDNRLILAFHRALRSKIVYIFEITASKLVRKSFKKIWNNRKDGKIESKHKYLLYNIEINWILND